MEKEMIQATGFFAGMNSKSNFDVSFKMEFPSPELANALQFVAGIGRSAKLEALINGETDGEFSLGMFSVDSIKIDRNARCKIQFKSNTEDCTIENISKLLVDEAIILLKAQIL